MKRQTSYTMDNVLFILLIFAFTASVLMVLMQGVRIYCATSTASEALYNERSCAFYITEKLRHGDMESAVYVDCFDSLNALYIENTYNDVVYSTILYYNEGWLNELFCEKGADFNKTDGTRIIETGPVAFSEAHPGLVQVETADLDGNASELYISLRSGG